MSRPVLLRPLLLLGLALAAAIACGLAAAAAHGAPPPDSVPPPGLDDRIDAAVRPAAAALSKLVFFEVPVGSQRVFFVVCWLAGGGVFLTLWFRLLNLRSFPIAWRTIRLKYSRADDPGEITHFQALAAALSGTVGLGNVAGVAIGVAAGGPGAAFWLFIAGFLGMTTKFCECTLGVRYREIVGGRVYGGSFYTLRHGLAERGLAPLGKALAVVFAVCCVGGAFGGGNMFQVNQAFSQLVAVTGGAGSWWQGRGWLFGLVVAVLTGCTIIGGIRGIARVTDRLAPFMCGLYMLCCLFILGSRIDEIPRALGLIVTSAFNLQAAAGGGLAALIWGFRRAAFSNEAGFGSSPTAHAAVKTRNPASEGYVAMLEPFVDTVVVCSLTALVLVVTGVHAGTGEDGIRMTSQAFATAGWIFPWLLCVAVLCFALSTLLAWSYYGQQAWAYLFGRSRTTVTVYQVLFCLFIVLGAGSRMDSVVEFSDAMMFAMCFPNFIGIYLLLPVIREEISRFREFRERVDGGAPP